MDISINGLNNLNYHKDCPTGLINNFQKYSQFLKNKGININYFDTNNDQTISFNEMRNGITFMQQAIFSGNYNIHMLPKDKEKSWSEKISEFIFGKKESKPPVLSETRRDKDNNLIIFEHTQNNEGINESIKKDKNGQIIERKTYNYEKNQIQCTTKTSNDKKISDEWVSFTGTRGKTHYKDDKKEYQIIYNQDGTSTENFYNNKEVISQIIKKDKNGEMISSHKYNEKGEIYETILVTYNLKTKQKVKTTTTKKSTISEYYSLDDKFIRSIENIKIENDSKNHFTNKTIYKEADGTEIIKEENNNTNTHRLTIKYPKDDKKEEEIKYQNNEKNINTITYRNGHIITEDYNLKTGDEKIINRYPAGNSNVLYYKKGKLIWVLEQDNDGHTREYNVVNEKFEEIKHYNIFNKKKLRE